MNDEEKQNYERFHIKTKGCKISCERIPTRSRFVVKYEYTCNIHNVRICRCGFEQGWHFGTQSSKFDKYTQPKRDNIVLPINAK